MLHGTSINQGILDKIDNLIKNGQDNNKIIKTLRASTIRKMLVGSFRALCSNLMQPQDGEISFSSGREALKGIYFLLEAISKKPEHIDSSKIEVAEGEA
jgi:hypothetical protein